MSEVHELSAELRERAGKGPARAVRRAGLVPGVVYGDKKNPMMISMEPRALLKEMRKEGFYARLYDVTIGKDTVRVLARDVQFDPVSDRPIHIDLLRVSATTKVTVEVPVHFLNEAISPGIKRGGVLNVVRHDVELVCRADSIPEYLEADLGELDIGDGVHISMIKLPEGVRPTITDRDFTIATIAAPTIQREEEDEKPAAPEGEVAEGEDGEKKPDAESEGED